MLVPERQALFRNGTQVRIGQRALELLTVLVGGAGQLLTKRELLARVWADTVVEDGSLKAHMAALRRVLGDAPTASRYIATVSGRGYRFIADVKPGATPGAMPDASAPTVRSHNLPASRTTVLGRTEVIEEAWEALAQSRMLSIVGAGGVGKTTVALAVARQAVGAFRNGVWWIDLASLTHPESMPGAIASAVGFAAQDTGALAALCGHLRERELMLVFDNCEHLIDEAARCTAEILANAAGIKILTTSREPLQVAGERVRRLAGLSAPPPSAGLSAAQALRFPAVQLFVERASASSERFEFRDSHADPIAEVCRRLDGLALAIELAVTSLPAFGLNGLLSQLDDHTHLLTGRRAGSARHRSLAASFDWSYDLLSADEAAVLRAVSVFEGEFDCVGASAVSNLALASVTEILAQLAAKSLISGNLGPAKSRYFLHGTTRHCSRQRLRQSDEEHLVLARHSRHLSSHLGQVVHTIADGKPLDPAITADDFTHDARAARPRSPAPPSTRHGPNGKPHDGCPTGPNHPSHTPPIIIHDR
ncbi:MAG TPA: winged helix-turn-helix domain-containing protein [Ideonella sp.]|uniref:ATP-binding protein n=1 Tax=Ideonella sp. TaxID=1929293 RepID=UPI002BB94FE5|nr:winged helix-turn-helix domain-containing protein [Ideonella sp.]HSI49483.1 winged helix-turn-helix domain-containing protein [Ideonella sp.]